MTSRTDSIAALLRGGQPTRPLLAYELRGSIVQLLAPGTTDPTWTTTPELLAAAVDARLEKEEKDIPAGTAFTPLPSDGHALIVRPVGGDFFGSCQCGQAIGRTPRTKPIDHLVGLWERHTTPVLNEAWAEAVTGLPAATPIGAS